MLAQMKADVMVTPSAPTGNSGLVLALEMQQRQLELVLMRLEVARRDLIPPPAAFWRGSARHTYDAGIDALRGTVDAAVAAVASARNRTAVAIAELVSRDTLFAAGRQMPRV
jgi:hypothetical protein